MDISTLDGLISKLQWWKTICSGDTPVAIHTITNAPVVSKGEIIDTFADVSKKEGITRVIIFGGVQK